VTGRHPKRTMTTFAVGLLLLDGILLLIASWYLKSWGMALLGLVLFIMAGIVLAYYRRYARTLAEVEQAKESLQAEVAELKRLIKHRDQETPPS
jgi:membrane protein implicated in regulation of membrane protease activity